MNRPARGTPLPVFRILVPNPKASGSVQNSSAREIQFCTGLNLWVKPEHNPYFMPASLGFGWLREFRHFLRMRTTPSRNGKDIKEPARRPNHDWAANRPPRTTILHAGRLLANHHVPQPAQGPVQAGAPFNTETRWKRVRRHRPPGRCAPPRAPADAGS